MVRLSPTFDSNSDHDYLLLLYLTKSVSSGPDCAMPQGIYRLHPELVTTVPTDQSSHIAYLLDIFARGYATAHICAIDQPDVAMPAVQGTGVV